MSSAEQDALGAGTGESDSRDPKGRPPLAVVGSQISQDEELFGRVFDRWVVGRLLGYLLPYRRRIAVAIGAVLLFTLTQLSIPLIIRAAIDDAVAAGETGRALLHATVLLFAAVVVVNYLANHLQETIVGRVAAHLLFDLRRAMYAHLQIVSLSFMDKTEVGRMMSRLQGDVYSLQEFLENSITALGDLVLLFGIVVIMLWLDFQLGLLTLSVVPVLFFVRLVWLPRARAAFRRARETNSIANGALAEGIHAVRTVQGMRREATNFVLYDEKATENLNAHLRSAQYAQVMVPIVDTLTGAAWGVVIVVGGAQVLGGTLDIGIMVAFVFYVQRFFDPIRSLTIQYSVMQRAMASGQRIFEVLDVPLAINDRPDAIAPENIEGRIEFRDVTFGYEKNQPVLKDINFTIEPGETVALVGPTGSGKTSTTSLLHRFYDVWDGAILLDGRDVRDYTAASLGRHIAMVLQDPFLFTGTIRENIRFRTVDAADRDVERAARIVGAHDFIMRWPDGYDTVLEQGGGQPVSGTAPALELRPGIGGGRPGAGARRGHRQHRFLHRAADSDRTRRAPGGAHRNRHRPSPRHRARRRPHPRAAGRPDHRDRQPPDPDGVGRPLQPPLSDELRVVRRYPRGAAGPAGGELRRLRAMLRPDYPIETDRLRLRPFEPGDLDDLHAVQALPEVTRYLYREVLSYEESRELLETRISRPSIEAEGDKLNLAIVTKDGGCFVGDVTLVWLSEVHKQGEIGFVLHPDHHGRGYAREAAKAMLGLGFEGLGLHRIIGRCDARNAPSAALMERLGMRREAHLQQSEIFKGEWGDEFIYAMLAAEWAALG